MYTSEKRPCDCGFETALAGGDNLDVVNVALPVGWNVANLYEAENPKHRPWWGCVLRRDEPYKVVKALGAHTAAGAFSDAVARLDGGGG